MSSPTHAPGASAGTPSAGPDAATPLLLLPVNIQTRFMDTGKGQSELWVRIYPDQIAVNSHEPELTVREVIDGQAYWNAVWRAGKPPAQIDDVKAPWRSLASAYGPPRAAWMAERLTPLNLNLQPATPTPAGSDPVPKPAFPQVLQRPSSWEKPAVADALPDAWTVVLVSGTQTSLFHGTAIQPSLAVSLTPGGAGVPGSPVDKGLQWLVDFDTAFQAGMALKIPLNPAQRTAGFDRLFVYGLRGSDHQAGATFTNLLNSHHYTDGLSLAPQGAPTNNTPDAVSAYSRKDPDFEITFQTERQAPLTVNPDCDAVALAKLLGIPVATFDHVAYADHLNVLAATDMLCVLWPGTLGYFLSQLMANVFSSDGIEEARQYVLANVRPRGPAPALRVGRTPYGVLPVTSLQHDRVSDAAGAFERGLADLVRKLWPIWLASSANAPCMRRGGDPDQDLMAVLGMDASSMTFRGRWVLGGTFLWNLLGFMALPKGFRDKWRQDYTKPGRDWLNALGYSNWDPRVLRLGFDKFSFPITIPTVQSGVLSETDPLNADADLGGGQKGNYINWLQTAAIADLQSDNYPGPRPTSLLYKLLRHSLLLEYSSLAGLEEVKTGKLALTQIQENEIVGVKPHPTTLTPWQVLARPFDPKPGQTWADYLLTVNFPAGSPFTPLNEIRASLTRLAALPTAELDRLLTETLDSCSHRLDVWATGIANAVLKRTRAKNNGLWLGCYGWVEDVRPESGRAPVTATELQQVQQLDQLQARKVPRSSQLPTPYQPLTDNGGYIYAPSQTQAAVAAVLRNGYMTHKQTAEEGLLAMDLSSERVRKALWLIGGVQQGQSLNALLGYLFEEAMHESGLDKYIQAFRNAYPVVGAKLTPASAPSEALAASNVVDGLALRTAWDKGQLAAGQNWGQDLPAANAPAVQNSVISILKTLDDYADALGDVSMAEAVFQIMRGNFSRGGGLMDAISRGSRPPDPDVVNTPRGGIDITHRVALLFAGAPVANPAWSGIGQHPRAAAEPWLDAWISQLLPDPAMVRCQVKYQDVSGPQTKTIALADLDVGPLDVLALADAAETPQSSELEQRIVYAATLPATAKNPQIAFQSSMLPAGSLLFPDVLYLAQKLRRLVGACRPLLPQDLTVPETNVVNAGGMVIGVDLLARALVALQSLQTDINDLQAAYIAVPFAADPVRRALLKCSFYGVAGSIPNSLSADSALTGQAKSLFNTLQARYSKAAAAYNQAAGIPVQALQLADVQGVFQNIFGNDFVVLPQVTPPNVQALQTAFGQSASLVSADPQAPFRWLRQLVHVRPGISRLDLALSAAQALCGGAIYPPTLLLGQLPPLTTPDRWLALPLDPANPPQKGRIALACIAQGDLSKPSSFAGLLIDEWLERIPNGQGTAAVAFHFEVPSARAPQALLLAVCPDNRKTWDDEILQAILQETLELAKIRTVDLACLEQGGQILPALYFASNLEGATVSTQFNQVKGN
jgi:hypothetical protein